jgi:hypothetical protein
MPTQKYFLKFSYLETSNSLTKEVKATRIADIDFSTITDYSTLLDYLYANFVLNFAYDSLYDIIIEDIQLIKGSNSGSGLIAELITCTKNDEIQSNNLIGAAVWLFVRAAELRQIDFPGITFNATTGTALDTASTGIFQIGDKTLVLYNY